VKQYVFAFRLINNKLSVRVCFGGLMVFGLCFGGVSVCIGGISVWFGV